jgi:hypothetical protein
VAADNAAMEAEPPKAEPPKRRRFQFRLRTLLIVVVPYVAIYAMGITAILSERERPQPPTSFWMLIEPVKSTVLEIAHGIGEEKRRNMAIAFTVAWLFLPIIAWAIWRVALTTCRWWRANRREIDLDANGA